MRITIAIDLDARYGPEPVPSFTELDEVIRRILNHAIPADWIVNIQYHVNFTDNTVIVYLNVPEREVPGWLMSSGYKGLVEQEDIKLAWAVAP